MATTEVKEPAIVRLCRCCCNPLPVDSSPWKRVCVSCRRERKLKRDAKLRRLNASIGRTTHGTKRQPAPSIDWGEHRRQPAQNTSALPGTLTKIEVMRQRLDRGEKLRHPSDAVGYLPLPMDERQHMARGWKYQDALLEVAYRLFVPEGEWG